MISSRQSVYIPYSGSELQSRTECYWKVNVVTNKGDNIWSEPSRWSVALLDSTDWSATWIGMDRF